MFTLTGALMFTLTDTFVILNTHDTRTDDTFDVRSGNSSASPNKRRVSRIAPFSTSIR